MKALVVIGAFLMAGTASAADFYAIVDNYGRKPLNAYVDMSVDNIIGPFDVLFDVFSEAGGPLAQFTVRTNANGIASTASVVNLFDLSAGHPMLVRARALTSVPAAGMLHTNTRGAPLTIGLWPANRRSDGTAFGVGREFSVALGSFRSASLLIASVGGSDQLVDVHVGTRGSDGSGIYRNPRLAPNAIWRVDLSQAEAQSNLVVSSTGVIVVQIMIDDGTKPQSFMVLPSN